MPESGTHVRAEDGSSEERRRGRTRQRDCSRKLARRRHAPMRKTGDHKRQAGSLSPPPRPVINDLLLPLPRENSSLKSLCDIGKYDDRRTTQLYLKSAPME
uniref:Uncharacterized protein n=1 Tax=Erythrolobus australicus TaxID=1077150 RepID=A0A7S1XIF0_9RHOD